MMKLFVTLSVVGLISCSKSPKQMSEPFPNFLSEDVELITYEGILPTEDGQDLVAVLHLAPGTPGMDSYYRLRETLTIPEGPNPVSMGTSSHGRYSVLLETSGRHLIQLNNRSLMSSLMRGKEFILRDRVLEDLVLRSNGDHELVLVN